MKANMIVRHCYTSKWIAEKRDALRVADPGLLEKCIHALELLGRLSEKNEFEFVFKGGTSLVLLLENLRRLSIDIDIVSTAEPTVYMPILDDIAQLSPYSLKLSGKCWFGFPPLTAWLVTS